MCIVNIIEVAKVKVKQDIIPHILLYYTSYNIIPEYYIPEQIISPGQLRFGHS